MRLWTRSLCFSIFLRVPQAGPLADHDFTVSFVVKDFCEIVLVFFAVPWFSLDFLRLWTRFLCFSISLRVPQARPLADHDFTVSFVPKDCCEIVFVLFAGPWFSLVFVGFHTFS